MVKFSLLMRLTGWFSQARVLHSDRSPIRFIFFTFLFYSITGNAYAITDMQTILTNLSSIIAPLTAMLLMISYAGGIYMIIHALTLMKKFGNLSTANQTQPGELGGPLLQFIVGGVLIYLPTSTDALMNSLFSTAASIFGSGSIRYQNLGEGSSLLGYVGADTFQQQWAALADTLVLYIQFIGLFSFIKGWFIISKAASPGAQQGTVARGFTHIIGGIVAINFVGAVNIINNTIFGS